MVAGRARGAHILRYGSQACDCGGVQTPSGAEEPEDHLAGAAGGPPHGRAPRGAAKTGKFLGKRRAAGRA
eukprot:6472038-Lingulodinium_polyedra.AAC.1